MDFTFYSLKESFFSKSIPKAWSTYFQESFSLNMDYILCLNELLLSILIIILFFVSFLLLKIVYLFYTKKFLNLNKNFFFISFNFFKFFYKIFFFMFFHSFIFIFFFYFFIYDIFLYLIFFLFIKYLYIFVGYDFENDEVDSYFNKFLININRYKYSYYNFLNLNIGFFSFSLKKNFLILLPNNMYGCFYSSWWFPFILNLFLYFNFISFKIKKYNYNFVSDVSLEIIWTLIPSFILCLLVIPSFSIMTSLNSSYNYNVPVYTVRVTGHQWWWEYEFYFINSSFKNLEILYNLDSFLFYNFINKKVCFNLFNLNILLSNFFFNNNLIYFFFNYLIFFSNNNILFNYNFLNFLKENMYLSSNKIESYMISDIDLLLGDQRLLEVDNRLIVPSKCDIRVLVTSDDVLHSWAIPSLGCKIDACPGRLNEIILNINKEGVFYGQCSELCGYYHGFMPIVVEAIEYKYFYKWVRLDFNNKKY